ncbi:MAG: SDR family NAD(P)-dependent oxidoreductase [Candidatus Thiodiazotropha sp.]
MKNFKIFVYTPAGYDDVTLAISACRAGGIGVLNAEMSNDTQAQLAQLDLLAKQAGSNFGIKLDRADNKLLTAAEDYISKGLTWVIVDDEIWSSIEKQTARLRKKGVSILVEVTDSEDSSVLDQQHIDGLVLKGHESGGFVGESSTFVLLQKWRNKAVVPIYVRGGLTPQVAAACHAIGVSGGVLDNQVLLLRDSPLAEVLTPVISTLSGNETIAVGDEEQGTYLRILVRPGHQEAQRFFSKHKGASSDLREEARGKVIWENPRSGILPLGQDVCFAGSWSEKYVHLADLFMAFDEAVHEAAAIALQHNPLSESAPMAQALGVRFPLVQGPMSRVSDNAEFARAIADGGALPMLAFALLKGKALDNLLNETSNRLSGQPWGIGLLGFAPQALLDEQIELAKKYSPGFAIIAGGRPDQAVKLEKEGIQSFLHVPSSNLIPLFIKEGARRFIFEGGECGGHIGPLSSFVLWSAMVDQLLHEIETGKAPGEDIQILFAGGIHDAVSSAVVQVLAAHLLEKGVKIGILMGSSYLFTKEIVATGAIVPTFQQEVVQCEHTVSLESGPGHASRCAYTPFARYFFNEARRMREKKVPVDECRKVLDDLIMGRLRIASKGCARHGDKGELTTLDEATQREEGMYMLGQVATLRSNVTDIKTLHDEVTSRAYKLINQNRPIIVAESDNKSDPVDIAIIGIASLFPKANSTQEFWENILDKVDAITEIPPHRWDWRLYYDSDRNSKDKIYSKWGGFIDDLAFDPTQYGMPPKSIESVDPMQLMALEVAYRTLLDAGYGDREFDRDKASVIIGASGGAGDVGMQYGLRSELPRFHGELPEDVANRLPEWTEDTFSGILLNVMAGRIANRLNFGGASFTTDAACASSFAAIYQGVNELVSGRSDMVLTGGVDTVQGPFGYLCFSKTQALSPRGCCNTFDVSADGIVISEGLAMVAMKRLADAERDGDRIYAVIKGVGGSSDGKAKGLTAPLPEGQLRAMRRAYQQAGFGPETVGLFEAHGTGTVAGDTAELESTTRLLKETGASKHQAVVGSVKTMIGHTKATAGVAGLIKAALSLHHHVLPPHFGVKQPNKVLQGEQCPLYLLDEAQPWLCGDLPRRAACSAFGFGGVNFHMVIEEYGREYRPWMKTAVTQNRVYELLLWDGENKKTLAQRLSRHLDQLAVPINISLKNLAYTLANEYHSSRYTIAIIASDEEDLKSKLSSAVDFLNAKSTELTAGVHYGEQSPGSGKIAVLFPGQGSQYTNMGRELACLFPVVADRMSEADFELAKPFSMRFGEHTLLSHFLFPRGAYTPAQQSSANKALTSTDVAQPALGAIEAGMWELLKSLGLKADMFAGHSYGEFVALFAAGAFDFKTLLSISEARGRFIVDEAVRSGSELGTMAAVKGDRIEIEKIIKQISNVNVANHNAPTQSIISGSSKAIAQAMDSLSKADIAVTPIPVAAAFHSKFVKPAQTSLSDIITKSLWTTPSVPVYSNTTGQAHTCDISSIKHTMSDHLVLPVEFVSEIEKMYDDGARIFIEVGPKSVLTRLTNQILEGHQHKAISIDSNSGGLYGLLNTLAELACVGVRLNLLTLFEGRACDVLALDDLQAFSKNKPPSKHSWMLNGSGARKATDPVKQVGLTLEQAKRGKYVTHSNSMSEKQSSTQDKVNNMEIPTQNVEVKMEQKMDEKRHWPNQRSVGSNLMTEYFSLMHQFLESQENVMSMYMNGSPSVGYSDATRRQIHQSTSHSTEVMTTKQPTIQTIEEASHEAVTPILNTHHTQQPEEQVTETTRSTAESKIDSTAPSQSDAAGLNNDEITEHLLTIVEDKTGYPRDMVGLDQKLEADLGIDSIKRVEIVGSLLQALPPVYGDALGENRGELNTQETLNGMLNMLSGLELEGTAVPFEDAGMGKAVSSKGDLPFRHTIVPIKQEIISQAKRSLNIGHYVITQDSAGIANIVSEHLIAEGCTVSILAPAILADDKLIREWCQSIRKDITEIAGVIHLVQLDSKALSEKSTSENCRDMLNINEKSLFLIVKCLYDILRPSAHIIAVSGLGGCYGRDNRGKVEGLNLQSGFSGLLKSLYEEQPNLRVKAIDVDLALDSNVISKHILTEVKLVGGRQEVGYPSGERTIFKTVACKCENLKDESSINNLVVLATGGLKGITAEILRELAQPGNTFLITGRSPLPVAESAELSCLISETDIRDYFFNQIRNGKLSLTPAEVQNKVNSIIAAREMRSNLEDFEERGVKVIYFAVDVTDEKAMKKLMATVYDQHNSVNGVIHGAGIIEDKYLADKESESWSRVVETKVLGLFNLQKYLRPESLSFFTVFSSVAGRYGNSGQSDYATANELMSRICCQLHQLWDKKVTVRSLCWGPWGATKFGKGMVTAETEAKFSEKHVTLVSAESGRVFFKDEILQQPDEHIEIVCGQGPWEEHEADIANLELETETTHDTALGALLDKAKFTTMSKGELAAEFHLNENYGFLQQHCIDDIPVLPAAAALEMMAEAASELWPGWQVVEVRDCRLLKGLQVSSSNPKIQIIINSPPYGNSDGFDVSAILQSEQENGDWRIHYRSVIRLEQQIPHGFMYEPNLHNDEQLAVSKAYNEYLFHGPCFQVIKTIHGLSPNGSYSEVVSTQPKQWMKHVAADNTWILDPALADAAAQMALLWAHVYRGQSALPARFGRIVKYQSTLPEKLTMYFERQDADESHQIIANVYFVDETNHVAMLIEDLECISSPELNRLGGTAKYCDTSSQEVTFHA